MPDSDVLVSIILNVKNGMPYVKEALNSVANQTYKNFEVVVQDGESTDGTLEFINSYKKIKNVKLNSEKDSGKAQGCNRAIERAKGTIIGIINADDLLEKTAVATAVKYFSLDPTLAAIYGGNKMVDQEGNYLETFCPGDFDLLKLMRCELVPTGNGSFYSKKGCKGQLWVDESLKSAADFDLWLRIADLPVIRTKNILASTRLSPKSSTCLAESYDQFCQDKIMILKKFLDRFENSIISRAILQISIAGIYAWAAESIYNIEGKSKKFHYFCKKALKFDPFCERVSQLANRV